MFTASEFKRHLLGVFEISIFMKAGVSRFDPDFNTMLRSFFWPLLVLPVAVVMASLFSPSETMNDSFGLLLFLHFIRIVVTTGLSLTAIYFFAKKIDRSQYMLQYITVSNWFEIAMFIIVSPILLILMAGGVVDDVKNYAIFVVCLGIVYNGYIATHAMRIPWELGTLVAVSLLFIQETGFDLINWFS